MHVENCLSDHQARLGSAQMVGDYQYRVKGAHSVLEVGTASSVKELPRSRYGPRVLSRHGCNCYAVYDTGKNKNRIC
jgi:hypothetical protein